MAIEKVSIPAALSGRYGLPAIEMGKLGGLVAIAGKNGAGKTRLLDCLLDAASVLTRRSDLTKLGKEIEQLRYLVDQTTEPSLQQYKAALSELESDEQRLISITWRNQGGVIKFVPKVLSLADPLDRKEGENQRSLQESASAGVDKWPTLVLPYIQTLQNRYQDARNPGHDVIVDDDTVERYKSLNDMVRSLLGVELQRINTNASLFGMPIGKAKLSDGQKVLLQLAVALHSRDGELGASVLLLDEPENHLHPAALVEVLRAIRKAAPSVQIWMATHSVPLLAYVAREEPMSIWCMKDGRVTNAGRHPEQVLRELLGDEEGAEQIVSFAGLPSVLAINNFSAECLRPPGVVGHLFGDSQMEQIRKIIGVGDRKVLDLGAGKGRLATALASVAESERWDYVAFDHEDKDAATCKAAIEGLYGSHTNRYFNDADKLKVARGEFWADIVVMTNVLHEIDPGEWIALFSADDVICKSLKDDGYLLVVEDQRIPVGELAHKFGFLVLDTVDLMDLFAVTSIDTQGERPKFSAADERGDGRLKAHLVSKDLLARVNGAARLKSIQSLKARAIREIRRLRSEQHTHANGLLHALWAQQLANATLFLGSQTAD